MSNYLKDIIRRAPKPLVYLAQGLIFIAYLALWTFGELATITGFWPMGPIAWASSLIFLVVFVYIFAVEC